MFNEEQIHRRELIRRNTIECKIIISNGVARKHLRV